MSFCYGIFTQFSRMTALYKKWYFQAHSCARRSGAEDHRLSRQQEHGLGQLRWSEEAGAVSRGQSPGDHQHLPHTLHLFTSETEFPVNYIMFLQLNFPGSNLRLVWLTSRVPSLEREEETESNEHKWGWSLRRSSSGIVWIIKNITDAVSTKHSSLRCIWILGFYV